MSKLQKYLINYKKKRQILARLTGQSANGEMMKHICFNIWYLHLWFSQISTLKTLIQVFGKILLNWYLPKIIESARKDGYLFRRLKEIRLNGAILKTRFLKYVLTNRDSLNGNWLVNDLCRRCRRFMIHKIVSLEIHPFRGMQSSVGKDGSQRLIQILIKAHGVCKKSIFF